MPGIFDHLSQRVDLVTGEVVHYKPPAPVDTEFETFAWNGDVKRWVATPTDAAIAGQVRLERDRRLADCDWVVSRAFDTGKDVPVEWRRYRVALRDITTQPGFPRQVEWPPPPG